MNQLVISAGRPKLNLVTIILTFLLIPLFQLRAIAANQADEATWWVNLYKANNGKSFCVPPDKSLLDMAKAVQSYIKSNNLPDSITDPQAIQILALVYPCGGIKKLTSLKKQT